MIEAKCERNNCSLKTEGTVLDIMVEAAVMLQGILRSASDGDDTKRALLEWILEDTYKKLGKENCTYVDVEIPEKGGKRYEP